MNVVHFIQIDASRGHIYQVIRQDLNNKDPFESQTVLFESYSYEEADKKIWEYRDVDDNILRNS